MPILEEPVTVLVAFDCTLWIGRMSRKPRLYDRLMYLGHVKVQPACQEAITKQKSEITKKRDKSRHGENGIFQRPTINKYECVRISILTSDDTAALSSAKLTEGEKRRLDRASKRNGRGIYPSRNTEVLQ